METGKLHRVHVAYIERVNSDALSLTATMSVTTTMPTAGIGESSSSMNYTVPPKLHNRVQDGLHPPNGSPAIPTGQSPDLLSHQNPSTTLPQASTNMAQTPHPFDPASMFPQHFMQEFLRLSTPVGQSPDDDTILAQALFDSKKNGKTYRQALEGLHGVCQRCRFFGVISDLFVQVNSHAANLWKDYYLDHHDRIEMLVSRLTQPPKTIKKPFTGSISPPRILPKTSSSQLTQKRNYSTTSILAPTPPLPKRKAVTTSSWSQHKGFSHTPPVNGRPPKRLRATVNSLSAPLVTADVRGLTLPQVDIPVPEPPSRSPSPPTKVQLGAHGNRYTAEDREYFIRFITWRLKQDPTLTKRQLCDQLAENVCLTN